MGFIQLGFLGALGALAIPIIIHLMFRRQSRPVDLGTLQFLKVVLRGNAKRRRLKRLLLLALRLSCVALVALLFARPYLLATESAAGDRLVVLLVDRSASMGLRGGSRPVDLALEEVRRILARSSPGTRRELAVFAQGVRPVATVNDLPRAAAPTSAGTDYDGALAWARDLCIRSNRSVRAVHVLTDLQRSGLGRGEPSRMPADIELHVVDLGRAFPRNVAVSGVTTAPATIRPGESFAINASIVNSSPLPIQRVAVRLHLESGGDAHDAERTVALDGGATADVAFEPTALGEGLWRGHVEVAADDDLAFDDRRYLALAVAPSLRVLLVDGDPARDDAPFSAETHFLQAALRLAPPGERFAKSPFDVRAVALGGGEGAGVGRGLPDLGQTDVVVLANVAGLDASDAARLDRLVARGGGLVVFTGDRVDGDSARPLAAAGLGIGTVEGTSTLSANDAEAPWRLERWDAAHPLFRPFADPEHGDLRRPAFTGITRIRPDPAPVVRVLAWFRGGAPAVLERRHGRGRVLWIATACDRDWGDWPRGRMFLPMVHQMIAEAAGLADGGRVRHERAREDLRPGIIDDEAEGVCRVVNVDPSESETARCTPREFAEHFGAQLREPAPARPASAGEPPPDHSDGRLRDDELWPWIALVLVGVLLLENFLANRTAA